MSMPGSHARYRDRYRYRHRPARRGAEHQRTSRPPPSSTTNTWITTALDTHTRRAGRVQRNGRENIGLRDKLGEYVLE